MNMQYCDNCAPVELDLSLCSQVLHQRVTELLQEERSSGVDGRSCKHILHSTNQ